MCVAIAKPEGKPLPGEAELRQCWQKHSDGAGFAYRKDGQVFWRKGFKQLKPLLDALAELPDEAKNGAMILHFRTATHSVRDGGNTHPFVLSEQATDMRSETGSTSGWVMAHNGVIHGLELDKDLSDTMVFIRDIVVKHPELFFGEIDKLLMNLMIGSNKLVFLSPDRMFTVGNWIDSDDLLWSNLQHRVAPPVQVYEGGRGFGYPLTTHLDSAWDDPARYNLRKPCYTCKLNGPHLNVASEHHATCTECWSDPTKKNYSEAPKDTLPHVCATCKNSYLDYNEEPCRTCNMSGNAHGKWEPQGSSVKNCTTCAFSSVRSSCYPCNTCFEKREDGTISKSYKHWKNKKKVKMKVKLQRLNTPEQSVSCSGCVHLMTARFEFPCDRCFTFGNKPFKNMENRRLNEQNPQLPF